MSDDTAAARVLLADDTADIRALLRLVLSREGDFVVVAEAADGREAVELAREHRPDVVLLDMAMPVMDGLEAIPRVRAAVPDCKIVVLSGLNADRMADKAIGAGADAYLEKGTTPTRLIRELRRICGRAETEVEAEPEPSSPITSLSTAIDLGWGAEELSVLTHELMGPLAVIEGFASLLERRPDAFTPATVSEHAAAVLRGARQLRALLQAVTDARRLEVSAVTVAQEEADVVALVRDVAAEFPVVVMDAPLVPVVALVDPVRIRQVVATLLSNAAKFSPPDTRVEVSVAVVDRWVHVSVRDHGPGVPVERRRELFRRFSRLDATVKGMGLGLYVSRGLARLHGGDLELVDTAPGSGATFRLRLPLRS